MRDDIKKLKKYMLLSLGVVILILIICPPLVRLIIFSIHGEMLCGILPRALANFVLRECNVKKDEPFASLSSDKALQIASHPCTACCIFRARLGDV